jgi:hypothetical protein
MGKLMPQQDIDRIRIVNGCFSKLKNFTNFGRHSNIIYTRCVCNFFDYKIHSILEINEYYQKHLTIPKQYIYKADNMYAKTIQMIKITNNFIEEKRAEEIKKAQEEVKKGI